MRQNPGSMGRWATGAYVETRRDECNCTQILLFDYPMPRKLSEEKSRAFFEARPEEPIPIEALFNSGGGPGAGSTRPRGAGLDPSFLGLPERVCARKEM